MKRTLAALLLLGPLFPLSAAEKRMPPEFDAKYVAGYLSDTGFLLSAPGRWQKKDWAQAALVLSAATFVYTQDESIQRWAQEKRNAATGAVSEIVRPLGDGAYVVPALALLYGYGRVARDSRARETALLGIEAVALSGVFTGTLKVALHRHRPGTGDGAYVFGGPGLPLSGDTVSFPSGHATTAFAVASIVAREYRDSRGVQAAAYGAASLAALSRVNDNVHWASDVLVGSAIGYVTGAAIYERYRSGKISSVSVYPFPGGISIAYRY